MATYKPGTVVLANVRAFAHPLRLTRYENGWSRLDDPNDYWNDVPHARYVEVLRVLPVIDVEGPYDYPGSMGHFIEHLRPNWKQIAAQVEEQTKSPRMAEPDAVGTVVQDGPGEDATEIYVRFAGRTRDCWVRSSDAMLCSWDEIRDPHPLER